MTLSASTIGDIAKPAGSDANGVTPAWTAKGGTDADRITLVDGKANLNTQPTLAAGNGSAALTLTLNKGAASDTLEYTVSILPLGDKEAIIDYQDGQEAAAWAELQSVSQDPNIGTVTLNKRLGNRDRDSFKRNNV